MLQNHQSQDGIIHLLTQSGACCQPFQGCFYVSASLSCTLALPVQLSKPCFPSPLIKCLTLIYVFIQLTFTSHCVPGPAGHGLKQDLVLERPQSSGGKNDQKEPVCNVPCDQGYSGMGWCGSLLPLSCQGLEKIPKPELVKLQEGSLSTTFLQFAPLLSCIEGRMVRSTSS